MPTKITIQLENASTMSTINKKLLGNYKNRFENGVENPKKTVTINCEFKEALMMLENLFKV